MIVISGSVLFCSKYTTNHLVTGLSPDQLWSLQLTVLPRHPSWIKGLYFPGNEDEKGRGRGGTEMKGD